MIPNHYLIDLGPLPEVIEFDDEEGREAWALCQKQQAIQHPPRVKPAVLELEPLS